MTLAELNPRNRITQWIIRHCMFAALVTVCIHSSHAADPAPDWESLRKQIEELRKDNQELKERLKPMDNRVETALDQKYGPNADVTTKAGKLAMAGFIQVWYYNYENDRYGLFADKKINGIQDSNAVTGVDSFRIRHSEIRFDLNLTDNVSGEILIEPAREATSFAGYPDNQANQLIFKRLTNTNIANVQTGAGSAPRLLQNAFIDYSGLIPNHDLKIGQFKPPVGEEGLRQNAQLDFAERSFIGQLTEQRDIGITAHGEWWDVTTPGSGRFQYWLGAFNAPGNFYGSAGQFQNRSDDNNAKDLLYRVLVRPFWNDCHKGDMELGYSSEFGKHGASGLPDPIQTPVNGLNRPNNWAYRNDAWFYYAPQAAAKGLWVRAEYEIQRDRNAPQTVIDLLGQGNAGDGSTQTNGMPFTSYGFTASVGYKLSEYNALPHWAKNLEFLFRYEQYQNVEVADPIRPDQTDVFKTQVWTPGVNYYVSGRSKISLNYNFVENPEVRNQYFQFHKVKNDNFILSFTYAF